MKIFKLAKKITNYLTFVTLALATLCLFGILINQKKKDSMNYSNFKHFIYENMNNPIYSVWKKYNKLNQILFHNPKGNAQITIFGDTELFANSKFDQGITKMFLNLQEKFQVTTNHANLIFENPIFNPLNDILHFPVQKVVVKVSRANRFVYVRDCIVSSTLRFSYFSKEERNFLKLKIESPNCEELNLSINSNLASENIKYTEVIFHTFFTFIFILLKFYYLIQLDHQMSINPNIAQCISLVTLLIFGTFELILGFEQMLLAIFNFPLFYFIILIGIGYFGLFFFILLKIVSTVLRVLITNRIEENQNFNLRGFLIQTYFKAHLTILLVFYLSLKCFDSPFIYVFWTLSILPQIVSNSLAQTRFIPSMKYLISFYVLTIFLSIYNHFYKYNFFYVETNKSFDLIHGFYVIGMMVCFLIMIVIQESISPFFFLPKFLMNKMMHDYFTNFEKLKDLKNNEIAFSKKEDITKPFDNHNSSSCCSEDDSVCVICLLNLQADVKNDEWEQNMENELALNYIKEKSEDFKLMITPCNHYFHSSCLLVWMSIKMECPLCKYQLPPVC